MVVASFSSIFAIEYREPQVPCHIVDRLFVLVNVSDRDDLLLKSRLQKRYPGLVAGFLIWGQVGRDATGSNRIGQFCGLTRNRNEVEKSVTTPLAGLHG